MLCVTLVKWLLVVIRFEACDCIRLSISLLWLDIPGVIRSFASVYTLNHVVSSLSQTSWWLPFCCLSLRLGLQLLSYISLPLYTRQVLSRPLNLIATGLFSQYPRSDPAKLAPIPLAAPLTAKFGREIDVSILLPRFHQ